jgi:hypothetical protein
MQKNKTTVKISCTSFDQLDLQSLNDCRSKKRKLATTILGIWGRIISRWKGLE